MPRRIKTDEDENIIADFPANLDVTSPTGITAIVGDYTGIDIGAGVLELLADDNSLFLTGNSPDISLMFGEDSENITFGINTKTNDSQPQDLAIQPQYPFATATGANRKPGNIVFNLGTPTNSGTKHGEVSMMWGGSERLSVSWDGSDATIIDVGQTFKILANKTEINPTSGDIFIGNSNGGIATYSPQKNYLSTGEIYNSMTHTQSGYTATQDRDRYWYGTTSGVGPTELNGSFGPDGSFTAVIRIVTEVVGCNVDGTTGVGTTIVATFKRIAGTLTLVTSTAENNHNIAADSLAASHTAVSNQIRLSVSGKAATNIRWEAYSRVYYGRSF